MSRVTSLTMFKIFDKNCKFFLGHSTRRIDNAGKRTNYFLVDECQQKQPRFPFNFKIVICWQDSVVCFLNNWNQTFICTSVVTDKVSYACFIWSVIKVVVLLVKLCLSLSRFVSLSLKVSWLKSVKSWESWGKHTINWLLLRRAWTPTRQVKWH